MRPLPFVLLLGLLLVPLGSRAGDDAPRDANADSPPADDAGPARLGEQIGDDPVRPLEPARPLTEEETKRREALGWFMKGRVQQGRNQFAEALESYEKALDLDPRAVEVYRAYVPLAFTLRKNERAIARALQLVELDPDNHGLMQQLGRQLARTGKIGEAVTLLEKAVEAPSLNKSSAGYVSLMRDLSVLYGATNQTEKLAETYEVVFEALVNPDKYELEIEVHAALERDPAIDYERIGEAFLETKRTEKAVRAFAIASERNGGKPGSLNYNLARLYLGNGDPLRARVELDKYLDAKVQAKGPVAYELLAEILEKLDAQADLIPRLEKLAEKDERNNFLLNFLGDQYIAANDLDKAATTFESIVERNRSPLGHVGLAQVHRLRGEPAKLLDSFAAAFSAGLGGALQSELEAVAANETLLAGVLSEGRERATAGKLEFVPSVILAGLAAEADDTEANIEFYRLALAKAEAGQKPTIYDNLADSLIDAEKYAEAVELLQEAATSVTDEAQKSQFLYKLSQAQELDGDTDEALATIREARKLLPDNPLLHYQHGWIHYHADQFEDAIRIFEEVLDQHAENDRVTRTVRFSLSNVYVQMKEMRKAEEVLEVVLEAEPDDPSVNNDLGYLYADQGHNLEKAEQMIRKAVTAEPDNAAYQDSMGWVLYRLGKFEEALPWLLKSSLDPDGADATIWDHLGDCYLALERTDDAVEAWTKGLAAFEGKPNPDEELRSKIETKLKQAKEE